MVTQEKKRNQCQGIHDGNERKRKANKEVIFIMHVLQCISGQGLTSSGGSGQVGNQGGNSSGASGAAVQERGDGSNKEEINNSPGMRGAKEGNKVLLRQCEGVASHGREAAARRAAAGWR
ncbi:hypothetical protein E2562_013552 [Oryza meyeriana var. granulata]|uniref:Uncharacterized protein n=1 Tax=Oryza meyeriana var. granulata TaxID=110450 RepID=A0A6G1D3T0_9ORYZ|nr:hypothetical protein E2562_013552 [Oryza meyeriana var. granulata]